MPKRENVRIVWVHCHVQPMMVRLPKGLYTSEILDRRDVWAPPERLVDPEIVAVAMHEHDGFSEGYRRVYRRARDVSHEYLQTAFARPVQL